MVEKPIYGAHRIADEVQVSLRTIQRWSKDPDNDFLKVGSMDNTGGGQGRALWTYPSSIHAYKEFIDARTAVRRRQAGQARHRSSEISAGTNILDAGSNAVANSSKSSGSVNEMAEAELVSRLKT